MKLPLGATIMTLCGMAILASLGTWQLQRLAWKNAIIEKLEAGYDGMGEQAPLSPEQLAAWEAEPAPIGYGAISGSFARGKAVLLGPRTHNGRAGYHLLLPLEPEEEAGEEEEAAHAGGRSLIVNAGWVDELWKDSLEERLALFPANVTARGAIHKPDWSRFASRNAPAADIWFRADIGEIAAAKSINAPYPFVLYADSIEPPLHQLIPHQERWLPRNKHLHYAIFWYALCFCFFGVYGFYVAGLNKKPPRP
ncbi:MAG: SURF1 family protein [Micavibrio sp.]